jgi:hypothetical protein
MVRVGKARMASIMPVACRHYQRLPPRKIKPNTPNIVASIGGDNYTHMKPVDYVGFDIPVTVLCTVATNWLYRLYF